MAHIIPMRFSIIKELMNHPKGLTPHGLYDLLKPIYGGEKQCNPKELDNQCMSLRVVGLAEIVDAVDGADGIVSTYRITEYGAARAKKNISMYF